MLNKELNMAKMNRKDYDRWTSNGKEITVIKKANQNEVKKTKSSKTKKGK